MDESPQRPVTGVELDPGQLSSEALRGLVEEYVTREGTDYGTGRGSGTGSGPGDWTLDQKVDQVLGQLERGDARIVFDPESETASIVTTRSLREQRGDG